MSKLGDVNKMYGQDFGVAVTNASADIVANSERLMSNMMIISSPMNSNNEDVEYPALFATDYNGKPIQLSYSVFIGNGLALNQNRILYLNIDSQTIKPQDNDGPLYVDTSYLQIASFNKPGVAMVANTVSRAGSNIPTNTFINIDNNGVLYLSNDFFTWFASQLNDAIYRNVAPLVNKNTRAWFTEMTSDTITSNYYETDAIMVSPIGQSQKYIEKNLTLHFTSTIGTPLNISINDSNQTNEYPIMEVEYNTKSIIDESKTQTIAGISVYEHVVDGIKLKFFPNYYLINNKNYGDTIHYSLRVDTNTEDDENQDIIFNFYQYQGNEISFSNLTNKLSLSELSTWIKDENKKYNPIQMKFGFENLVSTREFTDKFEYELNVVYKGSSPITLYNANITDLINRSIEDNSKIIEIELNNIDNLASTLLNTGTLEDSTIQLSENAVRLYGMELRFNISGKQFIYSKEFNLDYNQTGNFDSSFALYDIALSTKIPGSEDTVSLDIGDSSETTISINNPQSIGAIMKNPSIIFIVSGKIGPQGVSSLDSNQEDILNRIGGNKDYEDSSWGAKSVSIDANISRPTVRMMDTYQELSINPINISRNEFFGQQSNNGNYTFLFSLTSDYMKEHLVSISMDIQTYILDNIHLYKTINADNTFSDEIPISSEQVTLNSPIYIDFSSLQNIGIKYCGYEGGFLVENIPNENYKYKFTPTGQEGSQITLDLKFNDNSGSESSTYIISTGNIIKNGYYGGRDNSGGGDGGNTPGGNTPGGNTPSGGGDSGNTPGGNTPSGGGDSGNTPSSTVLL